MEADLGFSEANFSWEQYKQTRPPYPQSLFNHIYEYHASASARKSKWNLAMDVGAGDGVIAQHLAHQFEKVAVVEPNKQYLDSAKKRLSISSDGRDHAFFFYQHSAEEKILPPATVDLVVMGMSIQWTDAAKSMNAAAHHLKPGGTVAVVFYRRPYLVGSAEAALVWDEVWDEVVDVMMRTGQMGDVVTER